jgi:MYXO-CTERM domain-containing protein
MTKTKFSTWVGTSLLASSLLLLPVTTTFAQTATPTPDTRPPETRYVETRTDHDRTGLWGLLGLVGLLGLAGLRRRDEPDRVGTYTNPRERSRT